MPMRRGTRGLHFALGHPPTHAIDAGFYADTSALPRGRFRSMPAIRNPAALTASLASLWSAAATVAAALRITFARTLVLGVSVAATVSPAMRRDFAPAVAATLKPMHAQWAPTIIDDASGGLRRDRLAAPARVQRVALGRERWSGVREGAGRVLKRKGRVPARVALASDEEPLPGHGLTGPVIGGLYADEVVGFVLAACGLRLRLSRSFGLPSPARLALLPALALEGPRAAVPRARAVRSPRL